MINFLVKLANLLDDRGQYEMAREVDDLISKLAQAIEPQNLEQDMPLNIQGKGMMFNLSNVYKRLMGMYEQLRNQAQGNTGLDYKQVAKSVSQAFNDIALVIDREEIQLPAGPWAQAKETIKNQTANLLNSDPANAKEWIPMMEAERDAISWLLTEMNPAKRAPQQDVAQQVKPHKAPHKNPLIVEIQKLIGAVAQGKQPTGVWDDATNSMFVVHMMNAAPDKMVGGKFNGNLQEAYDILKDYTGPKAAPAPAAQPTKLPQQEDDKEVPPSGGPFGGPGLR